MVELVCLFTQCNRSASNNRWWSQYACSHSAIVLRATIGGGASLPVHTVQSFCEQQSVVVPVRLFTQCNRSVSNNRWWSQSAYSHSAIVLRATIGGGASLPVHTVQSFCEQQSVVELVCLFTQCNRSVSNNRWWCQSACSHSAIVL